MAKRDNHVMKALIFFPILAFLVGSLAHAQNRRHANSPRLTADSREHLRIEQMELEMSEMRAQMREMASQINHLQTALAQSSPQIAPATNRSNSSARGIYQVRAGDTLSEIAQTHGLSTKQLLALNPAVVPEKMQIGTQLRLGSGSVVSANNQKTQRLSQNSYTIKSGDTLSEIAQSLGLNTSHLLAANPGLDPKRLLVGKELNLPRGQQVNERQKPRSPQNSPSSAPAAPSRERENTHPVAPRSHGKTRLVRVTQETRYLTLAREYNTSVATLNRINQVNLSSNQLIAEGSELFIPQ